MIWINLHFRFNLEWDLAHCSSLRECPQISKSYFLLAFPTGQACRSTLPDTPAQVQSLMPSSSLVTWPVAAATEPPSTDLASLSRPPTKNRRLRHLHPLYQRWSPEIPNVPNISQSRSLKNRLRDSSEHATFERESIASKSWNRNCHSRIPVEHSV